MNQSHFIRTMFAALLLGVGPLVYAQNLSWFANLVTQIRGLVQLAVPVIVTLALALFLWGVVTFIYSAGDEKAREDGKKRIVWGLVGLFVLVCVWGIVALLSQLTGVYPDTEVVPPQAAF